MKTIKKHRYTLLCALISLSLLLGFTYAIINSGDSHKAHAYSIADGHPQLGNTQLVLTAGTAANLANVSEVSQLSYTVNAGTLSGGTGSATVTGGSGSIPCYNLQMTLAVTGSAASAFIGSSSSTCTYPIYPTGATGGGTAAQSLSFPQPLNTNQLWIKLVNTSTTNVSSGTINAIYTQ